MRKVDKILQKRSENTLKNMLLLRGTERTIIPIPMKRKPGEKWIPYSLRLGGFMYMPWPPSFDESMLPTPKYDVGDFVVVLLAPDATKHVGRIILIELEGGEFNWHLETEKTAMEKRYRKEYMRYHVQLVDIETRDTVYTLMEYDIIDNILCLEI